MGHLGMAMKTGNVMFGHVVFVYKRGVCIFLQFLRLIVAGKTPVFGRFTFTLRYIQMAILTFNAALRNEIFMFVLNISNPKFFLRQLMAG